MRIRKHLQLTGRLSAATPGGDGDPSPLQSSVFSLHNHLPPVLFDSSPSPSLPKVTKVQDLEADFSSVGNNSIEPDHSATSSEKSGDGEVTKLNVVVEQEEEEERVMCGRSDGKRWRCKSEAAKGKVFCNHHLEQLRNYDITRTMKMKMTMKKMKTERGDQVRGRRVRARKATLDSNPYDYYYYSGFGPSWGKKRGNTNTNTNTNSNNIKNVAQEEEEEGSISPPSSLSEMCEIDEIDYSKGDDDEIGKKRGGSPIINLELEEDEEKKVLCRRMSGSGWKCHQVAARGKLLCEHHLEQKRNCNCKNMKMKKDRAAPAVRKATFSSNSQLSSGNGIPDWGKNIAADTESDEVFADYDDVRFSPSAFDISEIDRIRIDYAEDDDED